MRVLLFYPLPFNEGIGAACFGVPWAGVTGFGVTGFGAGFELTGFGVTGFGAAGSVTTGFSGFGVAGLVGSAGLGELTSGLDSVPSLGFEVPVFSGEEGLTSFVSVGVFGFTCPSPFNKSG
jgi:hypothetical protein